MVIHLRERETHLESISTWNETGCLTSSLFVVCKESESKFSGKHGDETKKTLRHLRYNCSGPTERPPTLWYISLYTVGSTPIESDKSEGH